MPKKLLVADKSITIQKTVGITFAQEDYAVTYVSDGEDALQKARQLKPDVVLIHVNVPKMSGYDVCDALKKDPQTGHVPVLLLIGTHEALDEPRFKGCKADGSIIKPFESQALIDRVSDLVNRKAPPQAPAKAASPAAPPQASPRPSAQPPIPSPHSTISGQAARPPAQPRPTPSPAATISGQAPASRDTPMLDLDVPIASSTAAPKGEEPGAIEFSFDDSFTSQAPEAKDAPPPEETQATPAGEETWDFSELGGTDSPGTIEFASPSEEPTQAFTGAVEAEPASFAEPLASFVGPDENPSVTAPAAAVRAGDAVSQLSEAQVEAIVTKVFQKVIERIAWEVVPTLAETIIKEELARLTQEQA